MANPPKWLHDPRVTDQIYQQMDAVQTIVEQVDGFIASLKEYEGVVVSQENRQYILNLLTELERSPSSLDIQPFLTMVGSLTAHIPKDKRLTILPAIIAERLSAIKHQRGGNHA